MGPTKKTRRRACDSCRKRKCDRAPSQCNWCKHHGLLCTFDRPGKRATKSHSHQSESATLKDQPTEKSLPEDADSVDLVPQGSRDAVTCESVGNLGIAGTRLCTFISYNGIPFFSRQGQQWILERTGSAPECPSQCPRLPWQRQEDKPQPGLGAWELPDRSVVEACFGVFCESSLQLVFPIIEVKSFEKIVDIAYGQSLDTLDGLAAQACVLSFVAIIMRMQGKDDTESGPWFLRAQQLLPQILTTARCETLQVCAMLMMYNLFSGNIDAAATLHSTACRTVMMLGGHLETGLDPAPRGTEAWRRKRYLRRLFWLCYMYDKDIASRTGYAPVLDDDFCDLSLPPGYKQIDDFDTGKDNGDLFPGDIRLSIIKSKTLRSLYSLRALRKTDAELLRDIREIDDELEEWRLTIPPRYRPTLGKSHRIPLEPEATKPKQIHVIIIHLEYYSIIAMIHTASGRVNQTGVTTCQELALQASRSTIMNLASISRILNWGDFWIFVFYPISACLTIFCNILQEPSRPDAESDVELLQSVPQVIASMHSRRLSLGEQSHVQSIEHFVVDLIRLATAATNGEGVRVGR